MAKSVFLIVLLMCFRTQVLANDVMFTLLEKSTSYEMSGTGELNLVKNEFVSESILSKGGAIVEGSLKRLDSDDVIFEIKASESFFNRYANTYPDFTSLDKAHPNTDYVININGRTSILTDFKLTFRGPEGETQIPDPVKISLEQGNNMVGFADVDPEQDLRIVWSEFSKGAVDDKGILDDLIFALVSDCHGNSVSRSGIPYIMPEYLTFKDDKHVVPADKLQAGLTYAVTVIHVNAVDTGKMGDTTAMATYNTSTKMTFQTKGATAGPGCEMETASDK